MVISQQNFTTAKNFFDAGRNKLGDYLDRYRLVLYPTLGAVVASGIAYNWHWLTTAELVRLVTALPCLLMMYKCLTCGTSQGDRRVDQSRRATEPAD